MRIPFIMRIPRNKAYRRSPMVYAKKYGISRQAEATAKPAPPIPSSPSSRHSPTFHLLPVREHLLHIDRGPAQRLLLEMRVDVRGGLVVGVAHDLHGDQRVDAALVEQRHVVVPEVVRGQNKIVFAQA